MRGLLLVVAISGVALWWGWTNVAIGIHERSPLEITCADYMTHRPDEKWLKLTHCEVDFENMAIEQNKDKTVSAVYMPMRPEGQPDRKSGGGATVIVVKRTDSDMTELASRMDDAALPQPLASNVMKTLKEPTEGLVQFGIDLSEKDRGDLNRLGLGLSSDFVIMERGKEPKLLLGLLACLAGLAGVGFILRGIYRRFRPA